MKNLPNQALEAISSYFQVLAEPNRLRLLNLLRDGEMNVSELAEQTGSSTANVSRHLAQLAQQGMVVRETRGQHVFYNIGDTAIYDLCDLVCGNISRRLEKTAREAQFFAGPPPSSTQSH